MSPTSDRPRSERPIPKAAELMESAADWLEAQTDLSLDRLRQGPMGEALTLDQLKELADDPEARDKLVVGIRQSALAARVIDAQQEADRFRAALLDLRSAARCVEAKIAATDLAQLPEHEVLLDALENAQQALYGERREQQCPACVKRGQPHADCDPCGGTGYVAAAGQEHSPDV